MSVFGVWGNSRSAFLGLERRRDCARVSNKGFFGDVFADFGTFFVKKVSVFAIIERNGAVFEDFEKEGVVIALFLRLNYEAHEDHEEGKIFDKIVRIHFLATEITEGTEKY